MPKATMRLDKLLANTGYGTRKEVKGLIKDGLVLVDGVAARDAADQVNPAIQKVEVAGTAIDYKEHLYIMMNKPEGVVSATEDNRDETVLDLLEEEHRRFEPFPVGRLDKDTVGLLLLTTDGALAHGLLSPKRHVDKTYEAEVKGSIGEREQEAFKLGITLDDGYKTMPAKLQVVSRNDESDTSYVRVTIKEGKYHQVKRMFAGVGSGVLNLKRVSMGPISLDPDLEPGEYRELTDDELRALRKAANIGE